MLFEIKTYLLNKHSHVHFMFKSQMKDCREMRNTEILDDILNEWSFKTEMKCLKCNCNGWLHLSLSTFKQTSKENTSFSTV